MPTQDTVDPSRHEAGEHVTFDLVSRNFLDVEKVLAILGFSPEEIEQVIAQAIQQVAQYNTEMTSEPGNHHGGR